MPRLQELILNLQLATIGELNRAIFSCPESTLLAALEQSLGAERAEAIRERIAEAVKVPLLADEDVKVSEDVLNVSALELTPLVTKFKALPLRRIREGSRDYLMLAMSDPLVDEAKQAFTQLFGMPVKVFLAREKAVMNAYALSAARLSLAARKEAAEHPESNLPNLAKHIEDPEVRKAIHQLTATAVKHNASLVVLETTNAFCRARFTFADGLTSSVDISVSPVAVITSLFRRGQILSESGDAVTASCRVRFKSVSVNFVLDCIRDAEQRGEPEFGSGSDLAAYSVSLKNFVIDHPEHPGFWEGVQDGNASAIREMFDHPSGLYILAAMKAQTREFALRALAESYPDLTVAEVSGALLEREDLFHQAADRRVLVAVPEGDVMDVLKQLVGAPAEKLAIIRAFFGYYQLPRNCPFCSAQAVPTTELLLRMPPSINLPMKDFRVGRGCSVCEQRGVLGFTGLSSVLPGSGYAGQVLAAQGSFTEVVHALTKDCFSPLLEDGLRAAAAGRTSLRVVIDDVPPPAPDYFDARALQLLEPPAVLPKAEPKPESRPEPKPVIPPSRRNIMPEEPLRGRDAFVPRQREPEKADDGDWLLAPSADPEAVPDKKKANGKGDSKPVLLVIDDDADQRAILRRVFEIAGYKVEVAADGIDGIVSAVRLVPSLIIVDFMMPELDGRETIRRLKQGPTTGTIPVVALTAYADPDVELGLLQAGADDFCPKSVSKQVLLKRVERLVSGR